MPKRQYYIAHDFYNLENDEELTILPKFRTRQHTIQDACGPNATMMAMSYFNDEELSEAEVYEAVHCRPKFGTHLDDICNFLRSRNYEIETSIEHPKDTNGLCFSTMEDFRDFVIAELQAGHPIIIESVFFGGHYQVIIGYDRRSKPDDYMDDMIILADPEDCGDGEMDGYEYCNAFKFYTMWFDDRYLPVEHRQQPYVVVKGRKQD